MSTPERSICLRPVYTPIRRPLTVWGVERRLFFLALLVSAASFNLFSSFLGALLMFVALYGCAVWSTKRDPQMLRILLSSSQFRTRYDAAKHARVDIEV